MAKEKKRSEIEVTGVFDIETQDWSKFVVGCLYTGGKMQVFDWRREDDLVDAILGVEGTLWAHNGGKFDGLWFLSRIAKRGIPARVFLAGSRMVSVNLGKLTLRDSAALMPMELGKAVQVVAGEYKLLTGLACECGEACGGYCAIRRGMSVVRLKKLVSYLENDCVITYKMLRFLSDYARDNDMDLRSTIGASAWACASRWCGIPQAKFQVKTYEFLRKAYFGGRTQVFRPYAERGFKYDINSAYPAALVQTKVPVGDCESVWGDAATARWDAGFQGMYGADVVVPDIFIPPLPVRHIIPKELFNGVSSVPGISYPIGKIGGIWTRLELEHALCRGVKIEKIHKAVVWPTSEAILAPFMQRIWNLRAKEGKTTSLGKWLKLYANSLTGKLAQNPEAEEVVMNPTDDQIKPEWKYLDREGLIWTYETYRIPQCGYIQWAAYLTARTRTWLHEQLTDDGYDGELAVYCDTDSVFSCTNRYKNIGSELGQWLSEGRFRDFKALAPKVYAYQDEAGEFRSRAKGIPGAEDDEVVWNRLAKHEPVKIERGVHAFKTAVRRETMFEKRCLSRRIRADGVYFGDRKLEPEGVVTLPRNARELDEAGRW